MLPVKPAATKSSDISLGRSEKEPFAASPSAAAAPSEDAGAEYFALNIFKYRERFSLSSPPVKERYLYAPASPGPFVPAGPLARLFFVASVKRRLPVPSASMTIGWNSLIWRISLKMPMPSMSKNWL